MKRIKFHLYKIKKGQLESYSIGDAETIIASLCLNKRATQQFELFTIDSSGKERGCYEGSGMSIEHYLKTIVLCIEKIVADRERKLEKIKKVTEALFGVNEDTKGD